MRVSARSPVPEVPRSWPHHPKGGAAGQHDLELPVEGVRGDDAVVRPRRQVVDEVLVAGLVEREHGAAHVGLEHGAQDLIEVPGDVGVDAAQPRQRLPTEPLRHAEVVQHDITVLLDKSHGGEPRTSLGGYETAMVTNDGNWATRPIRRTARRADWAVRPSAP